MPKVKAACSNTYTAPSDLMACCLAKGQLLPFLVRFYRHGALTHLSLQVDNFGLLSSLGVAFNCSSHSSPPPTSPHNDFTSVLLILCVICYRLYIPHPLCFSNFSPVSLLCNFKLSLSFSYLCFLQFPLISFILNFSDSQGLFSLGLTAAPEKRLSLSWCAFIFCFYFSLT